ncbi:unnamed protein product [Mycena citricolor]|uniref:Uncharacterized protein n=1 Tax=Mycena citricolor TaxID=2018698 RepID=A0AAD2Q504_9AGAR|nr:unnamed protein product [Mycena citricolor]
MLSPVLNRLWAPRAMSAPEWPQHSLSKFGILSGIFESITSKNSSTVVHGFWD